MNIHHLFIPNIIGGFMVVILLSSCKTTPQTNLTPAPTVAIEFQVAANSPLNKLRAMVWVVDDSDTCGRGHKVSIQILDAHSNKELSTLMGDCHEIIHVQSALFSPDETFIVVLGNHGFMSASNGYPYTVIQGYVVLWSLETEKLILAQGCGVSVKTFAFSPDSSQLEVICSPGFSYTWNTHTGELLQMVYLLDHSSETPSHNDNAEN